MLPMIRLLRWSDLINDFTPVDENISKNFELKAITKMSSSESQIATTQTNAFVPCNLSNLSGLSFKVADADISNALCLDDQNQTRLGKSSSLFSNDELTRINVKYCTDCDKSTDAAEEIDVGNLFIQFKLIGAHNPLYKENEEGSDKALGKYIHNELIPVKHIRKFYIFNMQSHEYDMRGDAFVGHLDSSRKKNHYDLESKLKVPMPNSHQPG